MMDFTKLARDRYSVRNFSDRKVSDDLLNEILEVLKYAPSAKNLQPVKVYVINSKEAVDLINQCSPCIYGAKTILLFSHDQNISWKNEAQKGYDSGEFDAAIAATHIMLKAESVGISSCMVGMFSHDEVKEKFRLKESEEAVLLMPIGYAKDEAKPSKFHEESKELDEMIEFL